MYTLCSGLCSNGREFEHGSNGRTKVDDEKLALVLAELGGSRISSNLNQLAKASNIGAIDVSRDVESELLEACAAVQSMRRMLIEALGLKAEK